MARKEWWHFWRASSSDALRSVVAAAARDSEAHLDQADGCIKKHRVSTTESSEEDSLDYESDACEWHSSSSLSEPSGPDDTDEAVLNWNEWAELQFWTSKQDVLEELCGGWMDANGTQYRIELEPHFRTSCDVTQIYANGSSKFLKDIIKISDSGEISWGSAAMSTYVLDEASFCENLLRWWPKLSARRCPEFWWARLPQSISEDCCAEQEDAIAGSKLVWADVELDSDDHEFSASNRHVNVSSPTLMTAAARTERWQSSLRQQRFKLEIQQQPVHADVKGDAVVAATIEEHAHKKDASGDSTDACSGHESPDTWSANGDHSDTSDVE